MFHNGFMMSASSTPSRLGRGVEVPGIDAQAAHEKTATALSYAGCLTPPQSAHESRRGSLAYSMLDVGYPGAPPVGSFSLPTTPVHAIHHSQQTLSHPWIDRSGGHAYAQHDIQGTPSSPMDSASLHAALYQATNAGTQNGDLMGMYHHPAGSQEHVPWNASMNITLRGQWPDDGRTTQATPAADTGLTSSLFSSQTLSVAEPAYTQGLHNSHPLHLDGAHESLGTYCSGPQVTVVPSQLSPVDEFGIQNCSDYSSPQSGSDAFTSATHSFASTATNFSILDHGVPPSPDEAYAYAGDDDLLMSTNGMSHGFTTPEYRPMHSIQPRPHPRRRSAKRGKCRQPKESYLSWNNVRIELEGKACGARVTDPYTGQVELAHMPQSVTKPHICLHVFPDTGHACQRSFERSEHLKRHQMSHNKIRAFKCWLPNCKHEKGIGRGDNASDHFKTHLKKTEKGRRNQQWDWPEVKRSIIDNYDEKTATKFLVNLERWIRDKKEGEHLRQYLVDEC